MESHSAPLIGSRASYSDLEHPLFGNSESRPRERAINLVVGFLTALIVFITLISAFVFHEYSPRGVNIFLGVIIVLICASHLTVIWWYRQGDLDPKFRVLIFFNAFCIVLLCVCANLYFHLPDPNKT
ncbi:Transmembrane protein 243 [Amphibalanus amphitrite]|uniref:Transmembrane protein 243 n=1 Tax=Amphibalanus amphitrite TaxID=1232801 RepID=A0A6A4VIQ0_AMPAM|nr:transmembrane protein 243-like [Amphibalanus amphitrite]KAF0293463.1 Transmembrane protein 243 [Amphibalanus amphitrite]